MKQYYEFKPLNVGRWIVWGLFALVLLYVFFTMRGRQPVGKVSASNDGLFPATYVDPADGQLIYYGVKQLPAGLGPVSWPVIFLAC